MQTIKVKALIKFWRITLATITATITFTITPADLAVGDTSFTGKVGQPLSGSLGVTGGTPPDTVTVTDATQLPPGVTIGTDGSVSGTPTAAGTFNVPVSVSDSAPAAQ